MFSVQAIAATQPDQLSLKAFTDRLLAVLDVWTLSPSTEVTDS